MIPKLLAFIKSYASDIVLGLCIGLVVIISFNLGKMNALKKTPVTIGTDATIYNAVFDATENGAGGTAGASPGANPYLDQRVVASKNSDKYHFTWCAGAKSIKPENQVWFDNEQAASAAGYMLAGNCTK